MQQGLQLPLQVTAAAVSRELWGTLESRRRARGAHLWEEASETYLELPMGPQPITRGGFCKGAGGGGCSW